METLLQDVRYGLRMLRKAPGFTAVALITLTLGIGANTAIFGVVQAVILAPLPYPQPDRLALVLLYNRALKNPTELSYPDFLDWQREARSFQQLAAFASQDYDLTGPGTPEHLSGKRVSWSFFSTLGVKLALGREFTRQQDQQGGAPAVVISQRLWRTRFAASPQALGKAMTIDGVDYTVVGILPPQFSFGHVNADVYTPIGQGDPLQLGDRTIHNILCVARLKAGVSLSQSLAEMNTIQQNLDQLYPRQERGLAISVMPLKQALVGDVRGTLLLLLAAVGLVLLIACANMANLLLARSAGRRRELAVRSALGASRGRIVRQLVVESVLLSLGGGALGLAIAEWGIRPALAAIGADLPRSTNIGINAAVLLFTFGVSVAVGILFGLAPAWKSSNLDLQAALKEGSRSSTSTHFRAQGSLVIVQVALTLVLLAGAGLLFRTIRHLWAVDPGFDPQHVITFKVGLSPSITQTGPRARIAYQQLLARIRGIPGVNAADLTTLVPLSGTDNSVPFWIGSQRPASLAEAPRALTYSVGPDYLRVMSMPLLRGRFLTAEDTIHSPRVVVIDTVLAHTYFGDKDPVGQTITFARVGAYRVIGVVPHVRHWGLAQGSTWTRNQVYSSFYQIPDPWMPIMTPWTTVMVRTPLDASALISAVKRVVYGAGIGETVYGIRTMRQNVSQSMAPQSLPMFLLGGFAVLALLLAAIGIYGVISYSVMRRAHEIGIRMALGAQQREVVEMVIRQGLRLVVAGLAAGLAAAIILVRIVPSFSSLLYGVRASDPLTLSAVSVMLLAVAALACYFPAGRAAKVDPMMALRRE